MNKRIRVYKQDGSYTLDFTQAQGRSLGFHREGCEWIRGVGCPGAWHTDDAVFASGVAAAAGQQNIPVIGRKADGRSNLTTVLSRLYRINEQVVGYHDDPMSACAPVECFTLMCKHTEAEAKLTLADCGWTLLEVMNEIRKRCGEKVAHFDFGWVESVVEG